MYVDPLCERGQCPAVGSVAGKVLIVIGGERPARLGPDIVLSIVNAASAGTQRKEYPLQKRYAVQPSSTAKKIFAGALVARHLQLTIIIL